MLMSRAAGVLLHPTSLPGPHGIGDLGSEAYRFVDFLAAGRQQLWQVLPLGPVGYGNSPYAARSAFAGNPPLISLARLADDGLLSPAELDSIPVAQTGPVDYAAVETTKLAALRRAFEGLARAPEALRAEFAEFREANRGWLRDYGLYAALLEVHRGAPWVEWEPDLARRRPEAVAEAEARLAGEIEFHSFVQFEFFRQWTALRGYAHERGIRIVGDLPIFVAHDSADVWSRPEQFRLKPDGRPIVVAGVPPDYFSKTGQLWGNPIYNWRAMAETGYAWWIDRVRGALAQVDVLRLDHFRGFQAYWEVPATEETAVNGRWVQGPGEKMLGALRGALGELPFIAEDLGVITPPVEALRLRLGLPGMKVLQFAFGIGPRNPYLPHNYERNCVVYTGTHDNDTTAGWFASAGEGTRHAARLYLASDGRDIAWDLIRLALASVADWAIVPLQDLLSLGSEARMNTPGRLGENWSWRYEPGQLTQAVADRLAELTEVYGRAPAREEEEEGHEAEVEVAPE